MTKNLFVNLPIKNLQQTVDFFTALGFTFNPQFSDETSTCMIVSDSIFVMLLEEEKFKTFTPKELCDTSKSVEALLSLQVESREEVDSMVATALEAGGSSHMPVQDLGFMYGHSFQDVNGHVWEVFYMENPE